MSIDYTVEVLLNPLLDFTLALQASSPLQPFLDCQNFPPYLQHPFVFQNRRLTSGLGSSLIYYLQNLISKTHSHYVTPVIKTVWVHLQLKCYEELSKSELGVCVCVCARAHVPPAYKDIRGTSRAVLWLRVCLPIHGIQV